MTRRALVTGGAGFIGSHVAEHLLAGGWSVEVIDDLSSGKRENLPAAATFHHLDVRSADAATLLANGRFDAIVHLAAQMDVRRSVADPAFDAAVNVLGTLNLLEAVRASRLRARFVLASTGGAIYGDHAIPPNVETVGKEPDSPYAISKLAAEHYLSYYARIHGLDTVALRFANVYGPRQDPHGEAGVVSIFCRRILENQPLTVFGDGSQTRDYVYVRDVAAAVMRALDVELAAPTGIDRRAFNIGTGVATSVLGLVGALRSATRSAADLQFAPKRPGEQQASFLSIERARRDLGWAPRVALEQGLAETFAWFAERAGVAVGGT
jgi:UDP-glucose 4-epimerase